MIITKIIETSVDLLDPKEIYTVDVEALLLKKLNSRYANKCYQSILILEVIKIIRRSKIYMADNRLDGAGYVHVQFEAKGIIFNKGEILLGCEVIEIHGNAITAEHKYASIKLQKDAEEKIFRILTKGQKIPVVVDKVRYNINHSTVSMIATPYIPRDYTNIYYNITSDLHEFEVEKLSIIMNAIDIEQELHKDLSKEKSYDFFKDILYPYRTTQKFDQIPIISKMAFKPINIELKNFSNIKSGSIIVYPSEDNKINRRLFLSESADAEELKNNGSLVIYSNLYPVLADVCSKYLQYLYALRGMVDMYSSKERLQEMMVYWKICKQSQK